ncbi:Phenol 2-monooxygenase [Leucoagaricus sp. SymC.cos]|nr:Phenol 2-monooxygenase [Leucoagaricus sp. SymC.cos]
MPTSLTKEIEVDVLIIGAGPAGLSASNALARAGINVKVIDKRPVKLAAGQADGIQPRTVEVLQSYGLADRLLKEGTQLHMAAFYNPGPDGGIELTERVPDTTAPTARYPFEVTLHQGAIESLFLDSMSEHGLCVTRPFIPTSIELSKDETELKDPQARPVKVVLKNLAPLDGEPDTEIVHAKFVIGADGAHSWVRKTLGIVMEGEQTDYIWGVVDLIPETNFPDIRNKSAIHSENGSCMIIPREGDGVRLYIQLSERDGAVDLATGRVDKSRVGPRKILEVARKTLAPFTIETPESFEWWTIYIIGQRVASQFSINERILIVGDACHTHSPKAGQGMNASMNDSHNLAWKLVHVLRGWADISLLKTYEQERRQYAQDLIEFDRQFASQFSDKPKTEGNENGISHEEFRKTFQKFGLFSTGIGVHYAPSPIVNATHQSAASGLPIGERVLPQMFLRAADGRPYEIQDLLPSDTRFKVLVFAGNTCDPVQQTKLNRLAEEMTSILGPYSPGGDVTKVFDVLSFSTAAKETVLYTDLPPLFRSHWSKVFVDDVDSLGKVCGGGYEYYGIDKQKGAIVVVRPDGYVGMVTPLDAVSNLKEYLDGFMIKP